MLQLGAALGVASPVDAADAAEQAEQARHVLVAGAGARVVQAARLALGLAAALHGHAEALRLAEQAAGVVVGVGVVLAQGLAAVGCWVGW